MTKGYIFPYYDKYFVASLFEYMYLLSYLLIAVFGNRNIFRGLTRLFFFFFFRVPENKAMTNFILRSLFFIIVQNFCYLLNFILKRTAL